MAVGDMMNGLKKKMERFLYGDEEQPRAVQQPQPFAPAPDAAFTQQPQPQYAPPMQANYYQQPQPQPAAPQQPVYQQPQPAPQPAASQNSWNSRFGQKQEKVLNIRDYQQSAPETAAPEEAKPAAQAATRVVCARGMMDCRLAITLLRAGDAVLVTMENIKDPAEMRRLVDTLSGACYSLSASITKVSRYGVYLLAPQSMVVYADQMINQMNGAAPKAQRPAYQPGQRPGYQAQQPAYQPQASAYQQPVYQPQASAYQQPAYQPQASAYQQPAYQPQASVYQQPRQEAYQPQAENPYQQNAFTQRTAAPQENTGAFYARPQHQQAPQMPAFASQSANSGYVPDDMEVAE